VTTDEHYVNQAERAALTVRQQGLGRTEATCAALIPIKKSEAWWELTQDERREIFGERSRHIATGLEYLPAVARRLHPAATSASLSTS
jgi:chlorite dismutase